MYPMTECRSLYSAGAPTFYFRVLGRQEGFLAEREGAVAPKDPIHGPVSPG